MSIRMTARHRARLRAVLPQRLSTSLNESAANVGRGGFVIAVSSGLVAAGALPSQAASADSAAAPSRAEALVSGEALTASRGVVTFEAARTMVPRKSVRNRVAGARLRAKTNSAATRPVDGINGESGNTTDVTTPVPSIPPASSGAAVLAVASRYLGTPYVYGGSTPSGWDCAGATKYIFGLIGVTLPRTSREQRGATGWIAASDAKPGDLVFFHGGSGRVYHVGIYAGKGMLYDSGRSGSRFSLRPIWSSRISFGRVG